MRADAKMPAHGEGEVPVGVAGDVKGAGVCKLSRVPVGGPKNKREPLALADVHPVQVKVLLRDAPGPMHRRLYAKGLFHRALHQLRICHHRLLRFGVLAKQRGGVGDERGGGLVPGGEDEHRVADDVLVGDLRVLLLLG